MQFKTVITDKTEDAFIKFDISFAIGGSILKKAWGKIIERRVRIFPNPSEKAPSYCPLSMDNTAALAISIWYPALLNVNATIPIQNGDNFSPIRGSKK